MRFNYRDGDDRLLTEVYVSKNKKRVKVVNHAEFEFDNAFGLVPVREITYDDVCHFLAGRCMQPNCLGLTRHLEELGLSEYDPIAMCIATQGRKVSDDNWIEFVEG